MGFKESEIEVHQQATKLHGYHGDHTDLKANVVIRRAAIPGAYNDIGFERTEDGNFRVHISDTTGNFSPRCRSTSTTDQLKIEKMNEQWLDALTQRYARHVVAEEAEANGMWVYEEGWENDQ